MIFRILREPPHGKPRPHNHMAATSRLLLLLPSGCHSVCRWIGARRRAQLMGRYTAGHLFGLNLENLHEIITRHFSPWCLMVSGGLRAQLSQFISFRVH